MKKKVLALVMAIIVAVTSLVVAVPAFADQEDPATAIRKHNLALQDNVYLMYYVTFAGVPAGAETGVLVWTNEQESYTYGTETAKALYDGIEDEYSIYYFTGVSAKMMAQDIYAVSYIKDGDNITYSKLDKYSVLQYAYNKKDSTTVFGEGGVTLGELVQGILAYGALTQNYFGYQLDRLATATYYKISVTNGTLADGTKSGLYQEGDVVTLSAPAEKDGAAFAAWKDEDGTTVATETTIQVTVSNKNETYIAFYEAKPEGAYLSCEDVVVNKGDAFTLHISLNNCEEAIKSMGISFVWETTGLTVQKGEWSSDFEYEISNFKKSKRQGVATFSDETEVSGGVFSADFLTSENMEAGDYSVTVTLKLTYLDEDEDIEIPCQPITAKVSVQ